MPVQTGALTCCSSNGMMDSALGPAGSHQPTAPCPDLDWGHAALSSKQMGHHLWGIYRFQEKG